MRVELTNPVREGRFLIPGSFFNMSFCYKSPALPTMLSRHYAVSFVEKNQSFLTPF